MVLNMSRGYPTFGRYNESTSTLLRLSVLQAWAEVYVRAHQINHQDQEALDLLSTVRDGWRVEKGG